MTKAIAVGITGASGAIYATRTVAALLARGVHVELVVSDYGRRLLRETPRLHGQHETRLPNLLRLRIDSAAFQLCRVHCSASP